MNTTKRPLTTILRDILSDEANIPELQERDFFVRFETAPRGAITVADYSRLGDMMIRKIFRLQTLIVHYMRMSPANQSYEDIQEIANATGQSTISTMAQSLSADEDASEDVAMLKRILVNVVCEAFPSLAKHTNRDYFITAGNCLCCLEWNKVPSSGGGGGVFLPG